MAAGAGRGGLGRLIEVSQQSCNAQGPEGKQEEPSTNEPGQGESPFRPEHSIFMFVFGIIDGDFGS